MARFLFFLALSCATVPVSPIAESNLTAVSLDEPATPQNIAFIQFESEVNKRSADATVAAIDEANQAGVSDIVILLNTPGGEVFEGKRISKAIEGSKSRVVCVVDGMAASMGMYILQSCDIRVMTKTSLLMAHQPSIRSAPGGVSEDFASLAEYLRVMNVSLAEHIAARMTVSADELIERTRGSREWWFDWKTALQFGAVDKVVSSIDEIVIVEE